MMLTILCTRNKKSGQYGRFDFSASQDVEAIKESYATAVLEADEKSLILLKELDLYILGTFETATGVIESKEPEFLLDLGAITYGGKEDK